ncbi:right-handed parallel beta-helix repeat-containing protein, partial [Oceanithermus desulfurans]
FYREEPYRNKIVVRTDGSEDQPIRICGVPGPNGERPILDGDGAVNDPDDADAYDSDLQGAAVIMLHNRDYDAKVNHIALEGLHIRNARNEFSYTRTDGSVVNYEDGAACIRIQAADNVVIRGNELENCGNGIFVMSQGINEAHLTRNLLIEGNYLHDNGQPGSFREHGMYVQAIGVVYQYNLFEANTPGSHGAFLKDRSAGNVVRYNWFDSGSVRPLDIMDVEDAPNWYLVSEYLRELGCTDVNNCPGLDPDRLAKVQEADAAYRKTYVYGNFFNHIGSRTEAGALVWYTWGNDPSLSRNGTLYFFANTVAIRNDRNDPDDTWTFRLFYMHRGWNGEPSGDTVEAYNNIIYFASETADQPASHFCLSYDSGTVNFGVNWLSDAWADPVSYTECYPDASSGGAPVVAGVENLLDVAGAPLPLDLTTLDPVDTPLVRDRAQPLPDGLPAVDYQYLRHLQAEERPDVRDLGARDLP